MGVEQASTHKMTLNTLYLQSIFPDLGEKGLAVSDAILIRRNKGRVRTDCGVRRPSTWTFHSLRRTSIILIHSARRKPCLVPKGVSLVNRGTRAVRGFLKTFSAIALEITRLFPRCLWTVVILFSFIVTFYVLFGSNALCFLNIVTNIAV